MFTQIWKFIGIAIVIGLLAISLSGCSLIPKISIGSSNNNVPQQTEESRKVLKCAGELTLSPDGTVVSCSSGFYSDEQNYSKKERKMGFFERIGAFISNLKGIFGLLILVSIVLCFMGLGGLVVSFWQGVFGVGTRAIKATVTAIKNAKDRMKENPNSGQIFLEELAKQHSADQEVMLYINKLRAELNAK